MELRHATSRLWKTFVRRVESMPKCFEHELFPRHPYKNKNLPQFAGLCDGFGI